jgi:hypothetical protein
MINPERRWQYTLSGGWYMAGGALVWGLAMALSGMAGLYLRNGLNIDHLWQIAALFFAGGVTAWFPALILARFLSFNTPLQTRFSACFLFLSLTTFAMTALIFALQYRIFYSQWHAPLLTRIWILQQIFTTAAAIYQFAVLGLRLYLPLGVIVLIGTSFALARRMR